MTRDDLVLTRMGLRFRGRCFPCAIGRGGISAAKREGDGATPVANLRIVGIKYRADRMAHPLGKRRGPVRIAPIGPSDIWSDDPADPAYNHGLRAAGHPFSHERLRRGDPLYDLVLISNWNWPDAVPGRGSAIFVHQWRKPRHPTEGCLALRRDHLRWIARRLGPHSRLILRA